MAAKKPAASTMPAIGDSPADFTLQDQDGRSVSLRAQRGKTVVLYFYPRDNTPGCTLEAKDFSSLLGEFEKKNAVVFGVSTDSEASHAKFRTKCELTVPLLADPERVAHSIFGAWGKKNMYGREVEGTIRSTFVLDENGVIVRVWPKVRTAGHAADVLASL